jgi:UDP-N-acetylmuramoyl-L-alanyl-D-glutamate--2,6-diaminopimelate ligase
MRLKELLLEIDVQSASGDLTSEVSGVQYDSRAVRTGSVFVAIHGEQVDGNRFIGQALENGAVAIVSENSSGTAPAWIQVASSRRALAQCAASFYQHPTTGMNLVGITGTNGKTTTAHLVDSISTSIGIPSALLGTIEYRMPGFQVRAERTTPEAPDLERIFSRALEAGCRCAVMEVSSHAIAMGRVEELDFNVVAFTNLTPEHLDFHPNIEDYFQTKKRLFTGLSGNPPRSAVLNRDDASFDRLSGAGSPEVLSYGMNSDSDVYPLQCEIDGSGIKVDLATPSGKVSLNSPLLGRPNLYNIEAACGIGLSLGYSLDAIADGIRSLGIVPGRFENIDCGQAFRVLVDYAHTDDALAKVLDSAREITTGKVIVVFGAGGDRDRDKRRRMGEVAGKGSDLAVVTSDNPRNEAPLEIIGMIEDGLRSARGQYELVPDRRRAIATAIDVAESGDTVVIAGKGHETTQVIGDQILPFDDREVVRELLNEADARRNS